MIDIYNASFYSDYVRYGTCPGYGNSKEMMEELIMRHPQPVYRWFKGIILPSVDNLLLLSELFHVHMEDLLVTHRTLKMIFYL